MNSDDGKIAGLIAYIFTVLAQPSRVERRTDVAHRVSLKKRGHGAFGGYRGGRQGGGRKPWDTHSVVVVYGSIVCGGSSFSSSAPCSG